MTDPLKWQMPFLEAVLSPNPDALIPGLNGPIPAAIATVVYRNSILEGFRLGLRDIYRAVALLVGDDCFRVLAQDYVRETPSLHSDRNTYGDRFPDFLTYHSQTHDLLYLPDMARLDWANHEAYQAADMLSQPGLHPSARLVISRHPIMTIWRLCQNPEEADTVDLNQSEGEQVLVARPHTEVQMRVLPIGEVAWYQALLRGSSPQEAIVSALEADPNADPTCYRETAQRDGLWVEQQ